MWTTTSYYSYSPTAIATFKFSSLLPQIIEEEGKPFFYFYFFCYYTFHKPPYNFMWVCSMKNYISDSVRFILVVLLPSTKKNFFWAQQLFDSFIFIESIYVSTIYIYELSLGQCSCSIHQVRVKDIHVFFFHSSKAKKQKSKYVMVCT